MRRALAVLPLFCGLLLLAIAVVQAAEPQFPPLTGRVNDRAGLLSERDERELAAALERFEAETTNQIVVVAVESLQGLPIDGSGRPRRLTDDGAMPATAQWTKPSASSSVTRRAISTVPAGGADHTSSGERSSP